MLQYIAWVLFVIAAVNVASTGMQHATKNLPPLIWNAISHPTRENILGAIGNIVRLLLFAACLYFWYQWK